MFPNFYSAREFCDPFQPVFLLLQSRALYPLKRSAGKSHFPSIQRVFTVTFLLFFIFFFSFFFFFLLPVSMRLDESRDTVKPMNRKQRLANSDRGRERARMWIMSVQPQFNLQKYRLISPFRTRSKLFDQAWPCSR